jgi:hypothetical protein
MIGAKVTMDEESGRHFIGPVPAERECAGRSFRIVATQNDSPSAITFQCLRCSRELPGAYLAEGQYRLDRPGGQIP